MSELSGQALRTRLGIDERRFARLVREGLPHRGRGRWRRFSLDQVNAWLIEHGYAERRSAEELAKTSTRVCRTYRELADALGMRQKDAVRILGQYATEAGWPGRAAQPGKANGYLPLGPIARWLEERRQSGGQYGYTDEAVREMRRELLVLELQRKRREEEQQHGLVANVREVADYCSQLARDAIAILEPIPDVVVQSLPSAVPQEVRTTVHREVRQIVDDALERVAQIAQGEREEDDDEREGDG